MQNVFQNFINKLWFANPINSETVWSELLEFLPEVDNDKKTQNKIDLIGFCHVINQVIYILSL